jgi:hypothetical protein
MIEVKIPGLERLEANLRGLPAELRLEQRKQVSAAAAIVRDEVVRRIHSPGGHAAKGIKITLSGSGAELTAKIVSGNRAAVFAQRSRGPGTTPPPMKSARAMARRYGIPIEKARAIAIVIGRRGTVGHPVMAESLAAVRPRVERMFRDAFANVAAMAAKL